MHRFISIFALSLLTSTTALAMGTDTHDHGKEPGFMDKAAAAVGLKAAPSKPFAEPDLKKAEPITSKLILDAPLASDFVMGKKTATLNLVEYASMSCSHCAHFNAAVMPDIKKKYIETGKVRYILRQFPLNEPALKGAMLMECLGEQDQSKYYTFARVLFDAQNKWAFDANFLSNLETIAAVGGVSKDQFAGCTNSTERESQILQRQKLAKDELKIASTPTIIIGNEQYTGERTPEAVGKFIEKKLAEQPKAKDAEK